LLPGRVLDALHRLNPGVPASILEDVLHTLSKPQHPSLVQNKRAFHEMLLEGVPVEYEIDGEMRGDRVRLMTLRIGKSKNNPVPLPNFATRCCPN
jgi:hypothetical protein